MSYYPETFLRGLKGKVLTEHGYVLAEAFDFKPNKERAENDMQEMSVNWEDCDEAVDILLQQKKEDCDELKFNVGFARLETKEMKRSMARFIRDGLFSFERSPIDGNPYHGNLLRVNNIEKGEERLIKNTLANMASTSVYKRDDGTIPYKQNLEPIKMNSDSDHTPKVSIIVPVYNVEKYLARCLKSILAQTYNDWELLLIDDGSPDGSGIICDDYASKDSRIKVFHKENGGVSSARNVGLENAKGEWLAFVDADDALEINAIERCMEYCDNYDIVQFSMKSVFSEDGSISQVYHLDGNDNKVEYLKRLIGRQTLMAIWGGLYRNSLFHNNNIRFDTKLTSGEDWFVHIFAAYFADRIKIINEPLYLYNRYNEGAATYNFKFNNSLSVIKAYNSIKELIPSEQYHKELAFAKCEQLYNFITQCLKQPESVTAEQFEAYAINSGWITSKEVLVSSCSIRRLLILLPFANSIGKRALARLVKRANK